MATDMTKRPLHPTINAQSPVKTVSAIFDCADALLAKGSALAGNDVFEMIPIPAGAFVLTVACKITTVEGAASTFDVGDGATADGYLDGVDANASTNTQSFTADTTEAFGAGKLYTSADTIDIKLMTGTYTTFVAKISATYIDTLPSAV